jgi:hypothetical protein
MGSPVFPDRGLEMKDWDGKGQGSDIPALYF